MDDKHNKARVQRILIFSRTDLKENILRTFGAGGIIINKEFVKKVIRRRASKFIGTFIADSLTVKSKWSLVTYWVKKKRTRSKDGHIQHYCMIFEKTQWALNTFSLQAFFWVSWKCNFSNLCSLYSFWFLKWCRWVVSRILHRKGTIAKMSHENSFCCKNTI